MFSPRQAYSLKKIFLSCRFRAQCLPDIYAVLSIMFRSVSVLVTTLLHQSARPISIFSVTSRYVFYNVSTLIRHALPVIFLSLRPTLLRFLPRYYITTARPICHVPLRFYHANILIRHILSVFFRYTLLLFPAEFLHYYGTSHTCLQFS